MGSEHRGKNTYDREAQAQAAARRREAEHGWRLRVYVCGECELYHMARDMHRGLPILMMEHL